MSPSFLSYCAVSIAEVERCRGGSLERSVTYSEETKQSFSQKKKKKGKFFTADEMACDFVSSQLCSDPLLLRWWQEEQWFPEGSCYEQTRLLLPALNGLALPELAGRFLGTFERRAVFKKTLCNKGNFRADPAIRYQSHSRLLLPTDIEVNKVKIREGNA